MEPHGKHGGVPSEWEYAQIISGYNGFMDADAAGIAQFANAAVFTHFPLNTTYTQNARPTVAELQAAGYVTPRGFVAPGHYYMFYAGDYDSAAWLYNEVRKGSSKEALCAQLNRRRCFAHMADAL